MPKFKTSLIKETNIKETNQIFPIFSIFPEILETKNKKTKNKKTKREKGKKAPEILEWENPQISPEILEGVYNPL